MKKIVFLGFVVVAFAVVALIIYTIFSKPEVVEGSITKIDFAQSDKENSYVTIETSKQEIIVLEFETESVDVSVKIGGDSFHGKVENLKKNFAVGNKIRVETYDNSGTFRKVNKLLAVYSK